MLRRPMDLVNENKKWKEDRKARRFRKRKRDRFPGKTPQ
jgi:hypothetical protein